MFSKYLSFRLRWVWVWMAKLQFGDKTVAELPFSHSTDFSKSDELLCHRIAIRLFRLKLKRNLRHTECTCWNNKLSFKSMYSIVPDLTCHSCCRTWHPHSTSSSWVEGKSCAIWLLGYYVSSLSVTIDYPFNEWVRKIEILPRLNVLNESMYEHRHNLTPVSMTILYDIGTVNIV